MDDCEAEEEVARINDYRQKMLETLTGAHSMLKTLHFINLPCQPQPSVTGNPSFSALLRTLRTLHLGFDGCSWDRIPGSRLLEFFAHLPRAWLAPASTNLTCLALTATGFWGYLVKVNFRSVHFPRLRSLKMQSFVFSHDWQLDWILSHVTILELCLWQCPILTYAYWYGKKDNEGYPIEIEEEGKGNCHEYHLDTSWYCNYHAFAGLKDLRQFTTTRNNRVPKEYWVGSYFRLQRGSLKQEKSDSKRSAEDEEGLRYLQDTISSRPSL